MEEKSAKPLKVKDIFGKLKSNPKKSTKEIMKEIDEELDSKLFYE